MKRVLAILGIVAGLGLILYAVFSGASDEELIQARLNQLEEVVSVGGEGQNIAVRALQLQGDFKEIFEKDVRADIPELGSARQDRQALAALAARSAAYFMTLELDFDEVDIQIDGTKQGARVSSVAVVTATRRGKPEPRRDARDVVFRFSKTDEHGWRIASVRVGNKPAP